MECLAGHDPGLGDFGEDLQLEGDGGFPGDGGFRLTIELDDGLTLPPPAVALGPRDGGEGCFGPLPLDLWQRVALCLDPASLCRSGVLAQGCRLPRAAERELWARLCALHFPSMYASVLADLERGRNPNELSSPALNAEPAKPRAGRQRKSGGAGSGALGPRTPRWRRAKDGQASSLEPSPEFVPAQSPGLVPSSPGLSVSLPPSCLSDPSLPSPAPSPKLTPSICSASPLMVPSLSLDGPASPFSDMVSTTASSPCSSSADWASLYARRWKKKVLWEEAKRNSGKERSALGGAEGPSSSASAGNGDSGAEPKRVSELTRRELGCLSDAAYRLKICTLCGEKFSPGEARKEPTACCFHPGDFAPVNAEGWSRAELKQLRQHARQALRSAGGASWVQRHPRASKGHGHWLKGLGVLSSHKDKFRRCLEGDIPAHWACCSGRGLFAEGCQRGMHRHLTG